MLLIALCCSIIAGLAAASLLVPGAQLRQLAVPLGLTAAALLIATPCVWRRELWRTLALCCLAASLGGLRVALGAPADPDPLAGLEGHRTTLQGEAISTPMLTARSSRFTLSVRTANGRPVEARVQVVGDPHGNAGKVAIGDTITATGKLVPAEGGPLRTLLFPDVEITPSSELEPMAVAARIRADAVRGIQGYLPEPQASLSAGILLGGSGNLSPEFRQQLQRSGLAHIVAIDGLKQVVVTSVLGAVTVRLLGRRKAAVPLLLGVLAYTVLTGARPSAVRAGLMVGMTTLAASFGRVSDSLTSLCVAATLMTLHEPSVLLDVGFQLSYSATLGLIVFCPRLFRMLRGLPHWLSDQAGVTGIVTLTTLPVMLSVFHEISLVSPLSHIVAMPLLTPVLLGTALLSAVSAWPAVAQPVAWLLWVPATLLAEIVRISGSLPGAALATGHLPAAAAFGLGALLLAWCLWELPDSSAVRAQVGRRLSRYRRLAAPVALGVACATSVGTLVLVRSDGQLSVEPLPVTRGEALLIRGPTGQTVLLAHGRVDGRVVVRALAERLPVWDHGLNAIVVLDAESHAATEAVLERFPAKRHLEMFRDERLDLGGGAVLDLYWDVPDGPRGPGASAAITYGRTWLRLVGRPPQPQAVVVAETVDATRLQSDGARLRSDPTSAAARPG